MIEEAQSAKAFLNEFTHHAKAFANPSFLRRTYQTLMFPCLVLVRHNMGERYVRDSTVGVALLLAAAAGGPWLSWKSVHGFWTIFPVVGAVAGALVMIFWLRCARLIWSEILERKKRGILWHSRSIGTPRYGWPDDDFTNRVRIPFLLGSLGLVALPFTPLLGAWFVAGAIVCRSEYVWRQRLNREAFLDRVDEQILERNAQSVDDGAAAENGVSLSGYCSVEEAQRLREVRDDPLAGFEKILGRETASVKK